MKKGQRGSVSAEAYGAFNQKQASLLQDVSKFSASAGGCVCVCVYLFPNAYREGFSFYFALHTPHSTLYTLHLTPHTLQYTLHFTLHTRHFTLHTLHFALHTVHSTLDTA